MLLPFAMVVRYRCNHSESRAALSNDLAKSRPYVDHNHSHHVYGMVITLLLILIIHFSIV